MSRRTSLLILSVLGIALVILAIVFAFRFFRSRGAPPPEPIAETSSETVSNPSTVPEPDLRAAQEERTKTSSVQTVVKTFVERYGSFSTEAEFANLRDVLPLMTGELEAATRATLANPPEPTEYYGVTTKVVAVNVENMDETAGTAAITVSTQREEAKGLPQNISVKYQSIKLRLQKVSGEWKVAAATWMES